MRLFFASAALAAAFVLTPVAAGYAPALSEDFSITNPEESSDSGRRDVMRQLQAWWDVHAYYPKAASQSDQGGTVKLRLVIRPDGVIWMVNLLESSGSSALDHAGALAFRGGFVRPFPPGAPGAPGADIDLSLHYVLAHRHDQPVPVSYTPVSSKSPFTISNDPVKSAIVDTMLQRACTGTVVKWGLRNHPIYGVPYWAKVVFFRKPDGTSWVRFWDSGVIVVVPVTETGNVAQWMSPFNVPRHTYYTRYTVWADGENHLTGNIGNPQGTVEFTCATAVVPAISSNALVENRLPSWPEGELRE